MRIKVEIGRRLPLLPPMLAFGVFLVYLFEIKDESFFRHLVANPLVYEEEARRILAGLPRTQPFFLSPLYPAFMALVYALTGGSRLLLLAVQGFLLAANVGLVGAACSRILSRRIAIAAMFGMSFYWSFYYFAGEVLPTTLCLTFLAAGWLLFTRQRDSRLHPVAIASLVFAGLIMLVYAVPALRHIGSLLGGRRLAGSAGAYWGALALFVVFAPASTALLVVATRLQAIRRHVNLLAAGLVLGVGMLVWSGLSLVAALFALSLPFGGGGRLARAAVFVLGLCVPVAASMSHNYLLSGDLIPITTSFGVNLFLGNNPDSDGVNPFNLGRGDAVRIEADRQRLAGAPRSAFFTDKALTFVREEPGRWIRLVGKKALISVSRFNVDNNADMSERREAWRWLFVPFLHFGMVFPLGLAGIGYCLKGNRRAWTLLLGFTGCIATGILFFVAERFRLPAMVFLAPLAAGGLAGLYEDAVSSRWRSLGIAVLIAACAAVISNIDFLGLSDLEFPSITVNKAHVRRLSGDIAEARRLLEKAIEKEPESAGAYFQLGAIEEAEGNLARAAAYYLDSLERDPFFYASYQHSQIILEALRISPSYIDSYVVAIIDHKPHEDLRKRLLEYVNERTGATQPHN